MCRHWMPWLVKDAWDHLLHKIIWCYGVKLQQFTVEIFGWYSDVYGHVTSHFQCIVWARHTHSLSPSWCVCVCVCPLVQCRVSDGLKVHKWSTLWVQFPSVSPHTHTRMNTHTHLGKYWKTKRLRRTLKLKTVVCILRCDSFSIGESPHLAS